MKEEYLLILGVLLVFFIFYIKIKGDLDSLLDRVESLKRLEKEKRRRESYEKRSKVV